MYVTQIIHGTKCAADPSVTDVVHDSMVVMSYQKVTQLNHNYNMKVEKWIILTPLKAIQVHEPVIHCSVAPPTSKGMDMTLSMFRSWLDIKLLHLIGNFSFAPKPHMDRTNLYPGLYPPPKQTHSVYTYILYQWLKPIECVNHTRCNSTLYMPALPACSPNQLLNSITPKDVDSQSHRARHIKGVIGVRKAIFSHGNPL